jgi:hypothetical protein
MRFMFPFLASRFLFSQVVTILLLVCLEASRMWQRACRREETPVVLSRHRNASERRFDKVDDSRSPTDENRNGMKASGRVMNAAGE